MVGRTYLLIFSAASDLPNPHPTDCMQILFQLRMAARASEIEILSYAIVPPQLFLVVESRQSLQPVEAPLVQFYQQLKTNDKWAISQQHAIRRRRNFYQISREIEALPTREGLAHRPEDYRWSSAASHCGLRVDLTTRPHSFWAHCSGEKWAARLHSQLLKERWEIIDSL